MNEQIEKLEKQSYTEFMHERGGTYQAFDKQKFAELIVKECCRVMESLPPSTYHVGRSRMSEEIKQHFGVEK